MKDRPDYLEPDMVAVYDWLKANGVEEWLPVSPEIKVCGNKLSYRSFNWDGPRGWDPEHVSIDQEHQTTRTVPLLVPMPADIRTIIAEHHLF